MSQAGICPRLLDYELIEGSPAVDLDASLRMSRGKALHNMWQPMMIDIFGDGFSRAEEELSITLSDGTVVLGHPDGYIKDYDCVYELKTVGMHTFQMVHTRDHPLPMHIEQGNLYAHAMGLPRILFHYFDSSSCQSLWFMVPYNEIMAFETIKKFETSLINAEECGIGPRPYTDPTGSPCWFCHKNEKCYEGWNRELSGMKEAALTVTQNGQARYILSYGKDRLSSEKLEKKMKADLAAELLQAGVKQAESDQYRVMVSLGKKGNPLVKVVDLKE